MPPHRRQEHRHVHTPSEIPTHPTAQRSRTIRYEAPSTDRQALFAASGLEQMRALAAGEVPAPPISSHIGLELVAVSEGTW
ncbi:hypothetical protein [Janibacter melonis]|uniref:hypothetical protein n=1 Tax=Janibacter melonis TaxID=262209 RepID=UPI002094CDF4|nr:hypothetical protein [Janibacter melonis]